MGGNPVLDTLVRLPHWECEQCILQWTYRNGEILHTAWAQYRIIILLSGRDWGTCNGACGEVETFRACSDISISANEGTNNTTVAVPTHTPSIKPTTEPSPEQSTTCKATGAWDGAPTQDAWCNENGFHDPPYCPEDICLCSQANKSPKTSRCQAAGVWTGHHAITEWCQNNCSSPEPFCPSSLCRCDLL